MVPPLLKESSYGIGCTTWETIWHVVLPYTRAGVMGGIMLGLGRALGETMAVTFVIGNSFALPTSIFDPRTRSPPRSRTASTKPLGCRSPL